MKPGSSVDVKEEATPDSTSAPGDSTAASSTPMDTDQTSQAASVPPTAATAAGTRYVCTLSNSEVRGRSQLTDTDTFFCSTDDV